MHSGFVQPTAAVQCHHCGKRPITVWPREETPKSVARDILWIFPTFASEALLKATKGLRSAFSTFSVVRKSAYSGKKSITDDSSGGNFPSPRAIPIRSEVTLLEIDRVSCNSLGEK